MKSVVSIGEGSSPKTVTVFGGHDAEIEVEVEHLPHPQDRALDALGPEPAGGGDRQVVGPRRQQAAGELALTRRFDGGDEIGAPVLDHDGRVRHRVAERIADFSADDAGRRPGLGGEVRGVEAAEGRGQEKARQRADPAPERLPFLPIHETHRAILRLTR